MNDNPYPAIERAKQIVESDEFHGDLLANMTRVISAGRVLSRRVRELERIIMNARREEGDALEERAWLFRVEIDEDQYPKLKVKP